MSDGFTARERRMVLAIMQIKGEPFCTDCGGGCIVVLEKISPDKPSDLWTACTMCGNEMVWRVTPNHSEMLKRMVQMTDMKKGKILHQYQFICNPDGTCMGLCGSICHIHWRADDKKTENSTTGDDNSTVLKPF